MTSISTKTELPHLAIVPDYIRWGRRLSRSILTLLVTSTGLVGSGLADADDSTRRQPSVVEGPSVSGGTARISVLGGEFVQNGPVVSSQSRIVLYRLDDGRPGATSVFIDNRYHTSLVPGAWSQLCFNSGPVEVGTRQMEAVTRASKDSYDVISAMNLQPGQTHYLRVNDIGGRPVLRPIVSTQALQEITVTREQQHTVSRVAQVCKEGLAAQNGGIAGLYQQVQLASLGLVRAPRDDGVGHRARKTAQGRQPPAQAGADRGDQPRLARFVRADPAIRSPRSARDDGRAPLAMTPYPSLRGAQRRSNLHADRHASLAMTAALRSR